MVSVTVILPTCDRPALLPRAVESVLAQSELDLELVLVDSNRTGIVQEQHAGAAWLRDPRLRLIRPATCKNAAQARNAGLDAATAEWISYLDDDDAYRAGKLAQQLALAQKTGAPLVLCGAEFILRGRRRMVQCEATEWRGDALILRARWNTPLLFHRHPGTARFDESLSPGEDAEFAHRFLALKGVDAVPIVSAPLVEIYPQAGPRVNTNAAPVRPAAAKILRLRPSQFSRRARRRYVLQTLLAGAKLGRQRCHSLVLAFRLVRESRGADWRAALNAVLVSLRIFPGRWVS